MKGLYLYGVCPPAKNKKLPGRNISKGIGGGRSFRTPYKDVEAIVSEVSLKEFGTDEIQRRATDDLEWIKDKALVHERVIETAMSNSDGLIIPMKFGAVFKNRKSLVDSLKKDYQRLKTLLEELKGKEERSMKIYLKSPLLENEIKKSSPAIKKKLKETKHLPAGRQYFLEEEINEIAKKEARKSLNSYIILFLGQLKLLAEEMKENKILGKELTQRHDPMVFNGAFLVKKEKVASFQEEIQKLQTDYKKIGFTFESSGPWPPYNFV
jgi:hypothetical protein